MRFRLIELILFVSATALTINCFVTPDELHETIYFSFALIAILLSMVMAIGRAKEQRSFWIAFSVIAVGYLAFAHLPDEDENVPRQYGPEFTTQILEWAFYEAGGDPFEVDNSSQDNPFADVGSSGIDDPFADNMDGGLVDDDPFSGGDGFPADDLVDEDNEFDSLLDLNDSIIEEDQWVDTGTGLGTIQPYSATTICVVGTDGSTKPFFRIGHSAWALLFGWFAGHLAQFVYCKTHNSH